MKTKKGLSIVSLIKTLLLFITVALTMDANAQTTIVLNPEKDAGLVSGAYANNYYGSADYLRSCKWTSYIYRTLMKFDVSALPSGAILVSAKLSMYNKDEK